MASDSDVDHVRRMIRLPNDVAERAKYWADKVTRESGSNLSFNAFVALAVENEVARRNGVMVDAENVVTGRLNQVADAVTELAREVGSMRTMMDANYASLMRLSQGDSILTDDPVLTRGSDS